MRYYIPRHFKVQELVTPTLYRALGDRAVLVMDYRILKTADTIREFFDQPVTINNWCFGGGRTCSGFRDESCSVGAKYSQHKYGRALDMLISGVPANIARAAIIKNAAHFPYVTVMEDQVSWLHVDCRCTSESEIVLINP